MTHDNFLPNVRAAARGTIDAVLALLAEKWPQCFSVSERRRNPLKIGIHIEVIAALEGAATPIEVSLALASYTGNPVYLSRMQIGSARLDRNGNPAGFVTEEQATIAALRLGEIVTRRVKKRSGELGPLERGEDDQ